MMPVTCARVYRQRYIASCLRHALTLGSLLCCATAAGRARPQLSLEGDPQAGFATISWHLPTAEGGSTPTECELQAGQRADFEDAHEHYRGTHQASVVSGLAAGTRHFRVRCQTKRGGWSRWSNPAAFTVRYHSRGLAGLLFGLGALVFGLTAGFLLGARSLEREDG